jgi:hypothetical protein
MSQQLGLDNKRIASAALIQTLRLCGDPIQNTGAEGSITATTGTDPSATDWGLTAWTEGVFYWNVADQKWRTVVSGGTWADFATVAGGNSLDAAYNGGAGITVDAGAVTLTMTHATNVGMALAKSAGSGAALTITQTGTSSGNDVTLTNGSITKAGLATFAAGVIATTGGVTATAGGLHATAGGLTVLAGGATITGNSTITGDLLVTGGVSWTGALTLAGMLTADEYVFGTGVEPAATVVYSVYDGTSLTTNVPTAKTFDVAIAGADEYNFSATTIDMNANAIDNCGFIILNAATAPAATEVSLTNDNTGDLTLNALTTKSIHLAVANIDLLDINYTIASTSGSFVFNQTGEDLDFRVESNDCQYAIYLDGLKNSVVLGSNADDSSVDRKVVIRPAAWTVASDSDIGCALYVAPTGISTIAEAKTNDVVASAWFKEPGITKGGGSTLTLAATIYVEDAPTEAVSNYGIACLAPIGLLADDKDFAIGASADCILRWSTADASNNALALGLGASLAFHICEAADIASDWNVAAASNPTLYIHGATTPITEYIAISTDETDSHLNAVGSNWKFEIGGTAELTLAANALNLVDSILYGSAAAHTGDTADACLYLRSTSHGTKGWVAIANGELGLIVGSDGSVDRNATVGTNSVQIFDGTAPVGTLTNGTSLYSAAGELYAMDAAGNATKISPHNSKGEWVFRSYAAKQNKTLKVDMEDLINALVSGNPELQKYVKYEDGNTTNN